MVAKFTFQSVFSNSRRNLRRFSARGREESLEPYSILRSDWPTSKRKVWRHGNRFAARVCRRYFSKGKKRRPEMHLLVAGYRFSRLLKFFRKIILLSYPVETEIVDRLFGWKFTFRKYYAFFIPHTNSHITLGSPKKNQHFMLLPHFFAFFFLLLHHHLYNYITFHFWPLLQQHYS